MIQPVDGWQQTNDVDTLIRHAEMARSSLRRYINALSEEVGLPKELHVKMGPIKNLDRIFEKAAGRKGGRFDDICDICRGQFLIDSPEDVERLRMLLRPGRKSSAFNELWESRGAKIVAYDDYFAKPTKTGFRGINVTLEISGIGKGRKHYVEMQVVHRDMLEALKMTHELYSQKRTLIEGAKAAGRPLSGDQKAVAEYYNAEALRIHNEAALALGLDSLESPDFAEEKRVSVSDCMTSLAETIGLSARDNVILGNSETFDDFIGAELGHPVELLVDENDMAQTQILVEKPEDIEALRALVHQQGGDLPLPAGFEQQNVKVKRCDDYFATPAENGFRGMSLVLELSSGAGDKRYAHVVVTHKDMHRIYDTTHIMHKQAEEVINDARFLGARITPAQKEVLECYDSEIKRLHNEEATRLGLNALEVIDVDLEADAVNNAVNDEDYSDQNVDRNGQKRFKFEF